MGKFGTFFKILEPGEAKHSNFYEFGHDIPNGMVVLLNTSWNSVQIHLGLRFRGVNSGKWRLCMVSFWTKLIGKVRVDSADS